jgi:xylulokinase
MLLGIDVGTSATKAVLCDERGTVAHVASAPHECRYPKPGWSEQDPAEWWRALIHCAESFRAAGVDLSRVRAIGLSGQMHGLVMLDRAGLTDPTRPPLRHAILWNDQRTSEECAEIEAAVGGKRRLVELSGNAALTGFTLPKILWVRKHEAGTFARAAAVLLPKDYVRFLLTGEVMTDVGDGAGMLAMDIERRTWSRTVLDAVGVDAALLPRLVESGEVAGRVSAWAARATGLPEGIPVVAGSGDNMMGAIGAGVVRPGVLLATIGTSGVFYAHSQAPHRDLSATPGRLHTMCAADGGAGRTGAWCITGCTLSAGGALSWAREVLAPHESFETLTHEAAGAPPGCEGLVFLPQLTGERCPIPNPSARGGWIGLTARHTRAHLVRAVIEGVTYTMAQILGIMRSLGLDARQVRLGGGGARSEFWRQLQADVYGCAVAVPNTEEGPAYGAALLAGVGAGRWASVREACDECITITEERGPGPGAERYGPMLEIHAGLMRDLTGPFAALTARASA